MNNVTVNEDNISVQVVADTVNVTISESIGIPVGGTTGQVLKKDTADDYDVSWGDGGVPYTGATQDVNLGEFGLLTGNIEFDTSPTNAPTGAGSMVWNDTEGSLDMMLKGGSVNLPIGQKQVVRAVNGTGGNLTRATYRAVKITGAQGQRLQVSLARADNDANSKDTIGLVAEDISNNQQGFIVTSGTIESINTTGSLQGETWADGDTLYLSGTTSGVITNVKPSAPTHTVILGFVIYAHANNGKIYTKVDNGYEIGELHDVNVSTAASGDYLRYNGTIWVDSTIQAADLPTGIDAAKIGTGVVSNTEFGYLDGVTSAIQTQLNGKQATLTNPVTGTGTSGQVTYFTGTSAVTGSNNLFWDATNSRLGIGTTSPSYKLDVNGEARFVDTIYTKVGSNVGIQMAPTSAMRNTGGQFIDFGTGGSGDFQIRGGSGFGTFLSILNAGNVGVGNGSPSYRLDISGTLRNTTSAYFATSSGNVGVGVTTASAKLHVAGSVLLTNTNALQFLNASNVARSVITFFSDNNVYYDAEDGAQIFRTLGNERARINSGGNVSIGNTNNTYKLDISGTLRNTTDAYFATSSGGVAIGATTITSGFLLDVIGRGRFTGDLLIAGHTFGRGGNSISTNVAIGSSTMQQVSATSSDNVAVGFQAMVDVATSNSNIAIGSYALQGLTSGDHNVMVGRSSGSSIKGGQRNVGIGGSSLNGVTSGSYNIGIGYLAGYLITTGANNVVIGGYSGNGGGLDIRTSSSNIVLSDGIGNIRVVIDTNTNLGLGQLSFGTSATKTLAVSTGVAPTTSPADAFQMYSADITAGNAAAHFRTEGGAVIKLYQQTTGVAAAAFTENSGTAVNDASTFGGYTLKQIVQALQNAGFLA